MTQEGFAVWVTGPETGAVCAIATALRAELVDRDRATELLDPTTPGLDAMAGEGLGRRLALVARLLARHGVATILALPGARGDRDRLRADLGRVIEVHVHRGVAGPATIYEPPERPEVEIVLPEPSPGAGVARVLRTLEVLGLLPREESRAYSADEEREVIRRLKAFGYL